MITKKTPRFVYPRLCRWHISIFPKKYESWRRAWALEISRGRLATPSTRFRWRTLSQLHAFAGARFRMRTLSQAHAFAGARFRRRKLSQAQHFADAHFCRCQLTHLWGGGMGSKHSSIKLTIWQNQESWFIRDNFGPNFLPRAGTAGSGGRCKPP